MELIVLLLFVSFLLPNPTSAPKRKGPPETEADVYAFIHVLWRKYEYFRLKESFVDIAMAKALKHGAHHYNGVFTAWDRVLATCEDARKLATEGHLEAVLVQMEAEWKKKQKRPQKFDKISMLEGCKLLFSLDDLYTVKDAHEFLAAAGKELIRTTQTTVSRLIDYAVENNYSHLLGYWNRIVEACREVYAVNVDDEVFKTFVCREVLHIPEMFQLLLPENKSNVRV